MVGTGALQGNAQPVLLVGGTDETPIHVRNVAPWGHRLCTAASPAIGRRGQPPGPGTLQEPRSQLRRNIRRCFCHNNSAGNTWTSGGSQPCVTEPAPTLVISHGRAQFPWQGYMLTGNVTPSGALIMTSPFGQVFEGSINSQHRITGQVTGYCSYDLTWQKQS